MSYSGFPQSQNTLTMNPPPPPPMGLTMMAPAGPQLPNTMMGDGATQMQMLQGNNQAMGGNSAVHQQLQQMQQMQHQMQQMQHMQQMIHPAMNDAPLEFNINKNKPPMAVASEDSKADDKVHGNGAREDRLGDRRDHRDHRDRDRINRDRDRRDRRDRPLRDDKDRFRDDANKKDQEISTPPTQNVQNTMTQMNPMMSMNPMMNPMMGSMMGTMMPMMGGMMSDPSMLGMSGMAGMSQFSMMPSMMPDGSMMSTTETAMMDPTVTGFMTGQKGIIECKDCTLIPPSVNAPPPITRTRPPGCKTVYIGGIPENCTEEIIRDVFGRCGEMQTVRLSKKNFCHIRFVYEQSVEAAIFLSGYRMRIGNNTDAPNTGRLHVDFAQARDDQYEYECKQRALQREQRHRERMERERMRPPSPPPMPHYTDHEAAAIGEKLKTDDEEFQKSVQVVVTWLERGDCSKKNANTFYSMIQSTNSHVRRLLNEKMQFEEDLQTARDLHRVGVQGIIVQFGLIEKVFNCASHKKCWDHFTKAQRKNIETWKKHTTEIKMLQFADNLNEEAEEEMDVSDLDDEFSGSPRKKQRIEKDNRGDGDVAALRDENDSLRCQLEAYKNEVDLVRGDLKEDLDSKDMQLKMLQQTVQNLQKQLLDSKRRQVQDDAKVKQMEATIKSLHGKKEGEEGGGAGEEDSKEGKVDGSDVVSSAGPTAVELPDREAKLIGLVANFLHVHPFGAGVDYIWSFLTKLDPLIRPSEVEQILSRYPTVFRQELSGIGASMERRWVFVGFETS